MSVTSGFFNSVNHDRRYNAAQMSAIFDGIINDGVFANIGSAFAVTADTGVTVNIAKGRAWFNSAWIYNDALLPKTLEGSEVVLDRIDAIVIEVDHNENVRLGDIKIVKGTPSSSPKRPAMASEENKHQHPLAYIYRKAGSTKITQADITNMIGTSSCPYITGILQVQNIDNIVAQWEGQWNQWYATKIVETNTDSSELIAEMKSEFDRWFSDLKAVLADDVATNLASQVADLMGKFDTLAEEGCIYDGVEDSDFGAVMGSDGTPILGKVVLSSTNNTGGLRPSDIGAVAVDGSTAMEGALNMNHNRVRNVLEPESENDVANAGYVEKMASRASSPRNLLDNSDFSNPINQRGSSSYRGVNGYTIDRWKANPYTAIIIGTDHISLGNIPLTSSFGMASIIQYFETPLSAGAQVTMAMMEYDGTVHIGAITIPESGGVVAFTTSSGVVGTVYPDRCALMVPANGSVDIKWVALYEGAYTIENMPTYRPKGYVDELTECQRYYYRINTVPAFGYTYSASTAYVIFESPVEMRAKPTPVTSDDFALTLRCNSTKVSVSALGSNQYMAGKYHRFSVSNSDGNFAMDECISVMKSSGTLELVADINP